MVKTPGDDELAAARTKVLVPLIAAPFAWVVVVIVPTPVIPPEAVCQMAFPEPSFVNTVLVFV